MIDDIIECSAGLWLPHFEKYVRLLLTGALDRDTTTRHVGFLVAVSILCCVLLTKGHETWDLLWL